MLQCDDIALFVKQVLGVSPDTSILLAGDASARRYWRVWVESQSYIVMEQVADVAAVSTFADITQQLNFVAQCDFVPRLYGCGDGVLLLEDFGDQWLFHVLCSDVGYLTNALDLLALWQQRTQILIPQLSHYDLAVLLRELGLFSEWFLPYVGIEVDTVALSTEMEQLAHAIQHHPQLCVHRDFHSRNIMLRADGRLGLLDYQDLLYGSAAYDLISLTRDCYIRYDRETVTALEWQFGQRHVGMDDRVYWQHCCDEVALQRHLKVLGIFVRLFQRDGKAGYLPDLPRVLTYAHDEAIVLADYPLVTTLLAKSASVLL